MAKKKSTQKKKTAPAAKKNTKKRSTRQTKKEQQKKQVIRDNVIMISVTVVAVLMFAGILGYGGSFGGFCRQLLYGLFGRVALVFPILLFGICAYIYAMRGEKGRYRKPIILCILYIFICFFFELLGGGYTKGIALSSLVTYSVNTHLGGGLFGGVLEVLLRGVFGLGGAMLIDIAAIVVCLVFLTGVNLVGSVADGTTKAYQKTRDNASVRKEERDRIKARKAAEEKAAKKAAELAKKEKEKEVAMRIQRMEHKVGGVSLDTKIEDPNIGEKAKKAVSQKAEEQVKSVVAPIPEQEPIRETAIPVVEKPVAEVKPEVISAQKPEPVLPSVAAEKKPAAPVKTNVQKTMSEEPAALFEIPDSDSDEQYVFPPLDLLQMPSGNGAEDGQSAYENQKKLQDTLRSFGVEVQVTGYQEGPTVTRYELLPAPGVKVSKILSLTDDLKLALAAADIRIEAPIPGKSAIGIEVPNKVRSTVTLRELIDSQEFKKSKSKLVFAAGKDINGNVMIGDIQKMPHLLIAGSTGSGKSVCINTIIMSILYHANPNDVKLIMIDPKVVELSVYNGIPHLATPVVTDPKKAAGALQWAVREMTERYQLFAQHGVRKIDEYNNKAKKANADKEKIMDVLPYYVIIVDELADLMMVASKEVEEAIVRLTQLARAAGIHLIIATQRPSVDVITGLIKANMPSRIAFAVSSGTDSRTILDANGAEKLLGNGDMLYFPQGLSKPKRVQGAFVSDAEVSSVTEFLKRHNEETEYNDEISNHELQSTVMPTASTSAADPGDDRDELFADAGRYLIESEKGSIGSLQRKFRIGFNRAARIVDQLTEASVLGPEEGTKPRQILMNLGEFEMMLSGAAPEANDPDDMDGFEEQDNEI